MPSRWITFLRAVIMRPSLHVEVLRGFIVNIRPFLLMTEQCRQRQKDSNDYQHLLNRVLGAGTSLKFSTCIIPLNLMTSG